MLRVPIVLFAVLSASGCATSHWRSQELTPLGNREADQISALATEKLAAEFPPGQTTFELSPIKTPRAMGFMPSKLYPTFGRALETALRKRGFGVAAPDRSFKAALSESSSPYPKLAYVLDELKKEHAYRIGISVDSEYRLDGIYGVGASNFGVVKWTVRNGTGWK